MGQFEGEYLLEDAGEAIGGRDVLCSIAFTACSSLSVDNADVSIGPEALEAFILHFLLLGVCQKLFLHANSLQQLPLRSI